MGPLGKFLAFRGVGFRGKGHNLSHKWSTHGWHQTGVQEALQPDLAVPIERPAELSSLEDKRGSFKPIIPVITLIAIAMVIVVYIVIVVVIVDSYLYHYHTKDYSPSEDTRGSL